MERNRVVITGLGMISPIGNSKDETWTALCSGTSGIDYITRFDITDFNCKIGGEVKNFDPSRRISKKELRHMDRFVKFALYAAMEAVDDSKLDLTRENRDRVGVIVGSGIGGLAVIEEQHSILLEKGPTRISPFFIPMLIVDMASGQVSIHFKVRGPNSCVATACASGSNAIGDSFRIIQRGDADMMITGGTESAITPTGFGGFCAMKALSTRNNDSPVKASRPFDKLRDGFVMGEGAGVIVLESLVHALKRDAYIYGEVVGYGMTGDAYHITAPAPGGEGAARAMSMALKDASMEPGEVDYLNAHGTSTPLNDRYETMAIKAVFGAHASRMPVSSTKSMTGHLLGAAGGVEAAICTLAIRDGIIPPTINYEHPDPDCDLDYVPNQARRQPVKVTMSNTFGFGGHNAVLIIKRYEE